MYSEVVPMKVFSLTSTLLLSCILLYSGHGTHAFPYNYYATTKCLVKPQGAFYGGGVIVNPEFEHNIEGWTVFGHGKVEERITKEGNRFIVAHSRTHPLDSFSQKIQVEEGRVYSFSAWIQVSEGSESVGVIFKPLKGDVVHGGRVIAKHGCWTLLKGGMVANFTSPVDILFESKNTAVEIWVDNVSLQPFTKKQWRSHQEQSINKARKNKVRIQATHANKTPLKGAQVSVTQTKSDFPFGCAIHSDILQNSDYQKWFASRFKFTTFVNEMKWYSTEYTRGQENYSVADAMVQFAKQNGISIRGHNIFWDDPKYQLSWVNSLSPDELRIAADKRINSLVSRYRGQVIAWDVMNENLHFRFFEDKLGNNNASAEFYSTAQRLDPNTIMFLNEYNTIEQSEDKIANPDNYMKKLNEILSFPGNENLLAGIGLQGHFSSGQPNIAFMRSSLDILGTTGLPIWLTEVDIGKDEDQAENFEEILREGYSHPAVKGIIMFAGPETDSLNVTTTLTDKTFKNTPSGDVVDKLIAGWKSGAVDLKTDAKGSVELSLFHGDYDVIVKHPLTNSSTSLTFRVAEDKPQVNVHVHIET